MIANASRPRLISLQAVKEWVPTGAPMKSSARISAPEPLLNKAAASFTAVSEKSFVNSKYASRNDEIVVIQWQFNLITSAGALLVFPSRESLDRLPVSVATEFERAERRPVRATSPLDLGNTTMGND